MAKVQFNIEDVKLREAAVTANEELESVLGSSSPMVKAEWSQMIDHKGRSLVNLKLENFGESLDAQFAPAELHRGLHLRERLYSLWGDLLQAETRTLLSTLNQSVALMGTSKNAGQN